MAEISVVVDGHKSLAIEGNSRSLDCQPGYGTVVNPVPVQRVHDPGAGLAVAGQVGAVDGGEQQHHVAQRLQPAVVGQGDRVAGAHAGEGGDVARHLQHLDARRVHDGGVVVDVEGLRGAVVEGVDKLHPDHELVSLRPDVVRPLAAGVVQGGGHQQLGLLLVDDDGVAGRGALVRVRDPDDGVRLLQVYQGHPLRHFPLLQLRQLGVVEDSCPHVVPDLRVLDAEAELAEADAVSLVAADHAVLQVVDIVREEDVGVEDADTVMVVVHHLDVVEHVVGEVRLDAGHEGGGPVVEQPRPLHLDVVQLGPLGRHAQPEPGPGDVVAAQPHVVLVAARVQEVVSPLRPPARPDVGLRVAAAHVAHQDGVGAALQRHLAGLQPPVLGVEDVAHLLAGDGGGLYGPAVVAHGAPLPVHLHLQPPLALRPAAHQPHAHRVRVVLLPRDVEEGEQRLAALVVPLGDELAGHHHAHARLELEHHPGRDLQPAVGQHVDVPGDGVHPGLPQLLYPRNVAPHLLGLPVDEDVLEQRLLQHELRVDVVGEQVGDVLDLGEVVPVVPVEDSLPHGLLVLVAEPVESAVQLDVGLHQLGAELVPGQRVLDNVAEHADVARLDGDGGGHLAAGVEPRPRLHDDVVLHPVVGHRHVLPLQVVVVRETQVEHVGAFIVVKSVFLQQ